MKQSWLVFGAFLFAGCGLYFGGDDQPPPNCDEPGGIAGYQLRDPQTGECETINTGCADGCACPDDVPATGELIPDWATCGGACDALDESSCLAAPGCHAEYTGTPCPQGDDCLWSGVTFWTCSAVTPDPSVDPVDCWGLDAYACASSDQCASAYTVPVDNSSHQFNACFPEPGTPDACAAVDCAAGSHCEEQCTTTACDPSPDSGVCQTCTATCVADDSSCTTTTCGSGTQCEEVCSAPACDPSGACPASVCTPVCEPIATDPGDCKGTLSCNSAPPACPAATTPGIANGCWTGYCIPTATCGKDPGTCDASGVRCNIAAPACPSGTEPGITNGCWSGYCIPTADCPMATPCASITDEKTCVSRADCEPVYNGTGCTCDASGCTCQSETFARCEALPTAGK